MHRLSFPSNSGRDGVEIVLPEHESREGEVLASVSIRGDFFTRTSPLGELARDVEIRFPQYPVRTATLEDLLAGLKAWLADETPVAVDIGADQSWLIELGPQPGSLTMAGKPALRMSLNHDKAKLQYGFLADYSCVLEFAEGLERYLLASVEKHA